ncbi:pectin acetylesterase 12-like [Brassica napus]|uniref:pectin acetylesterase 12-like n=1 Tax=Brassica napus TaxID=3708 RepID=UPI002079004C|nr:pectin acetylesterase 12-like [Brassica napus]
MKRILSDKAQKNPDLFNWNRLKLRYCDGASFREMVRMRTDVSGGRTIRNLYNGIVEFQSVKTTCLVCAQTILIQLRVSSQRI